MHQTIPLLQTTFLAHANASIAKQQKAYLRDQFEFYGIKTPVRREVQKPFLIKKHLPEVHKMPGLVRALWSLPQRENYYFAQELVEKYVPRFEEDHLALFEYMITTHSWWDTVDFIATKIIKPYFKKFPHRRDETIERWLASNNIWLQRTCVLFQLMEKERTDKALLAHTIQNLLGSQEFFINKAIGWALRDLSKTDDVWVREFVQDHSLHPMSKREALRLLE